MLCFGNDNNKQDHIQQPGSFAACINKLRVSLLGLGVVYFVLVTPSVPPRRAYLGTVCAGLGRGQCTRHILRTSTRVYFCRLLNSQVRQLLFSFLCMG